MVVVVVVASQASHSVGKTPERGYLQRLIAYGRKAYGLGELLARVRDGRKRPRVSMADVVRSVFACGLLRLRSFNALDPQLAEVEFGRCLGRDLAPDERICSVDTLGRVLKRADPQSFHEALSELVRRAERHKVFREGWIGALRYGAIDGWEPISSRSRHCDACLERRVRDGEREVTEYYHRYVVCLLLGEREEIVLGFEPIRNAWARRQAGEDFHVADEGEQPAAIRLLRRLRASYDRWLEVIVADSLYANGPFLTAVTKLGFSAIVIAKKDSDEPLRDAVAVWGSLPGEVVLDRERHERWELWDCPQVHTLETYDGPIRVVRAVVTSLDPPDPTAERHTWCALVVGPHVRRLSARQVIRVARGRWHLENTGFNQWTRYWQFEHVFITDHRGILGVFALFFLAFNLLQLFVYRQLRTYGRLRGRHCTRTILRVVDVFLADLHRLDHSLSWDTS